MNCTKDEITKLDRKTRLILTMNQIYHLQSDVDRVYISREKRIEPQLLCRNKRKKLDTNIKRQLQLRQKKISAFPLRPWFPYSEVFIFLTTIST